MLARTLKIVGAALVVSSSLGAGAPAMAETLAIDGQVTIKPAGVETPQRGSSMTAVEARFGLIYEEPMLDGHTHSVARALCTWAGI